MSSTQPKSLLTALEKFGFEVLPSATNFLFARHSELKGDDLMDYLRSHKILVRHFSKPHIADYLRITIGTDAEMERLASALEQHPAIAQTSGC